jgi:hypothetical protein
MLCGAVPEIEKFVAVAAVPLSAQVYVKGRLADDEPLAVKLIEPVAPIKVPVAAGVCDAHVGGILRITVHDFVAVLEPFEALTVRLLLPGFKLDERTAIELADAPSGLPFKDHVNTQLESLGVTPNVVLVEPTLLTRGVAEAGIAPLNVQAGNTVTFHWHVVES